MGASVFSVAALFILFREALEASVVISVMLQLCARLKLNQLKKWVWIGALSGCAVAIVIAVIFIIIFYVAQNAVFTGEGKAVFSGFVTLLASFLITLLAFAMLRFKNYEKKWEMKLRGVAEQKAISKDAISGIFLLAFTTTLREGIEAVVFIAGVSAGVPASSIPLPAVVGIIMGIAVGVALYWTGRHIADIAWFMFLMCALLFLLAAGLTARAITTFQSIGWFGYYGAPAAAQPWQNQLLWNSSACCSQDITKNKFFGILYALFGYTDSGTAIWLFAYCFYWIEVAIALTAKGLRGELLTSKTLHIDEQVTKATSSGSETSMDLNKLKAQLDPAPSLGPKGEALVQQAGSSGTSPYEVSQNPVDSAKQLEMAPSLADPKAAAQAEPASGSSPFTVAPHTASKVAEV